MWQEIAIALCLMMVLEGMLPFISPRSWRQVVHMIDNMDDNWMRLIGLGSMLTGTILLLIIN